MGESELQHAVEARPRWYLIQTRPRQADRAEENLRRQGYSVYHPRYTVERIRRNRRVAVEAPLFPNYLFIQLDRWHDNWYPLRSTRGVARLVTFGDQPLPVDEALIAEIRRRVERGAVEPAFRPGETVNITQGPFKGLEAIFSSYQDEHRVLLLIDLLQRQLAVSTPVSDVRRCA